MIEILISVACYIFFLGFLAAVSDDEGRLLIAGVFLVLGIVGVLGYFGVLGVLGVLGEIAWGVVLGGSIVVGTGLVLLAGTVIVIEVGERRVALVPAHVRAVSPLAPRTLRWMRGLLPGGEGTVWLAEVASCLAEISDKKVRRRYIRSYRRAMPRLVWTSWAEYLSVARRRELL